MLHRLSIVTRRSGALTVGAAVLVSFVALWQAGSASAATPHPKPTVSVTPSRGLRDREQVTVRVRGFPRGEKVFLSECAQRSEANGIGCGTELAAQPFGFTNAAGRTTVRFTVRSHAAIGPITPAGAPQRQACGDCVLVATDGVDADHPHLGQFEIAALAFHPAALPFTGLPGERLALLGATTLGIGVVVTAMARRRHRTEEAPSSPSTGHATPRRVS